MRASFLSVQGEARAHAPTAALFAATAGAPNPKCPVFSAPSRICRSESAFTSHKPPQGHIRTSPFPLQRPIVGEFVSRQQSLDQRAAPVRVAVSEKLRGLFFGLQRPDHV